MVMWCIITVLLYLPKQICAVSLYTKLYYKFAHKRRIMILHQRIEIASTKILKRVF